MAPVAKNVALSFGLLTTNVSVHSAIEPAVTNKSVCVGTLGVEHPPTPIRQERVCSTCGPVPYTSVRKAREVPGGYVLLEDEDLTAARASAVEYKKRAALTPHPASEVELATATGDKLYHLVPEAGFELAYAVLHDLLNNHPELAFCCQWTPRTSAGLFTVRAHRGLLVMQERIRPAAMRPAPSILIAAVPEAMTGMAETVLAMPGMVTAFDPGTYADTYTDTLAGIVAGRDVTPGLDNPTPTGPITAAPDALSALAAMLARTA